MLMQRKILISIFVNKVHALRAIAVCSKSMVGSEEKEGRKVEVRDALFIDGTTPILAYFLLWTETRLAGARQC